MIDDKFSILSSSVESIRTNVSSLTTDVAKLSSDINSMNRLVASQETLVDGIRHDVTSRRATLNKLESWISDSDQYRNNVDSQIALLSRDTKALEKRIVLQNDNIDNRASKADIKIAVDGVQILASSAVSAAMGPMQVYLERELEGVRRTLAAVRMGMGAGAAGAAGAGGEELSKEDVDRALSATQPSELLVKAVVGSSMSELSDGLEKKLTEHLMNKITLQKTEITNDVSKYVSAEVARVVKESGYDGSGDVIGLQEKLDANDRVTQRMISDEINKFMRRVESSEIKVESLARDVVEIEKSGNKNYKFLEKQIDDSKSNSVDMKEDFKERMREINGNVKDIEIQIRDEFRNVCENINEKSVEQGNAFRTDVADVVKRLAVSESVIAQYASNDDKTMTAIKNFGARIEVVEGIGKDVMKRVVDSSDVANRLSGVEGTNEALSERVKNVEGKVSEFKKKSSAEAESSAGKVREDLRKVKDDLSKVKDDIESNKQKQSSEYVSVVGTVEGLKKDVEILSGKDAKRDVVVDGIAANSDK
jgi:predicted  nucleic acid-binding Zn-ribbon protein